MAIHPTAIVDPAARLGSDVEIGPHCIVGANVALGDGVRLLGHVVLTGQMEIGARTVVYPHAVLGGEGQIRGPAFAEGRLVIGADNVIRELVTMSAGSRKGGGITAIGDRGYFMAGSHAGHDCHVGNDVTLSNGVQLAGHVHVGDGVIFGGLSAVHQFTRIGRGAFVGGLTGVTADVIPYGMVTERATVLRGLNLVGLKRRGLSRETIHNMRAAYRAIFLESGTSLLERARRAGETWAHVPQIQEIVAFIVENPKRRIASPQRARSELET